MGELREQLVLYRDDAELSFSGLRFFRLKMQSEQVVQLQFQEQVYREQGGELIVHDID